MNSQNKADVGFETGQSGSGGGQGISDSAKKLASSITTDVAEGIGKAVLDTPMSILEGLLGTGSGQGSDQQATNSEFSKKLDQERKSREVKLRQHRMMIASYEQEHEKVKQEMAQQQQTETQEDNKRMELKQLKKRKKQEQDWAQAIKGRSGSREGTKKMG